MLATKTEIPQNPKQVFEYLKTNGFRNPHLETKLLLSVITQVEFNQAQPDSTEPFDDKQIEALKQFWQGIQNKKPIQYQIGYTYVRGLKIQISNETICPGTQIEFLTDAACKKASYLGGGVAVDPCTGSGVIATVLAKEFPHWEIHGIDISQSALSVAQRNKAAHQLTNLHLLQGDLFTALEGLGLEGKVDLIVANPPYCPTGNLNKVPAQVRDYSPRIALDGGDDGLYFYRRILQGTKTYLKTGGYLVLEYEVGRSHLVRNLLEKEFSSIEMLEKHTGEPRVLVAYKS